MNKYKVEDFINKTAHPFKLLSSTMRNQIYLLEDNTLLKTYRKKIRWQQEVIALKNNNFSDLYVTKLLDYGSDGRNFWIKMTFAQGEALATITDIFKSDEIVYSIGRYQALYHNSNPVRNSSSWDKLPLKESFSFSPNRIIELNCIRMEKLKRSGYMESEFLNKIEKLFSSLQSYISEDELVLAHNDFTHRNLLGTKDNREVKIKSLIDFELSFPGERESDLARLLLDLIGNSSEKLIGYYLGGYNSVTTFKDNFEKRILFYLLSLAIEIFTWSHSSAFEYFNQILFAVNKLINKKDEYIKMFKEIKCK